MIEFYKIKTEKDNKVLYVYLNYDYEFGKDINDKVLKSIQREIDIFNIAKVVIVIGGIVISTIYIKDNYNYSNINIDNPTNIIENLSIYDYEKIREIPVKEIIEEKEEIVKNETIEDNQKEAISINKKKKSSSISKKETEKIPDLTYITVKRSNGSTMYIELEEYVIGVVAAEMPASFSLEALKAQAVVARTYALKRASKGETLTDTSSTQNYKDIDQMKEMWGNSFNTYYYKIVDAVSSTKGQTLTYNGEYIDALYHSTSNGYTEDPIYVWGNSVPYLKSVVSNWDKNISSYTKTNSFDFITVLNLLGIKYTEDINVEIISRNESGRITEIKVGNNKYTGVAIRNILSLRSADFDIELSNGNIIFVTRGYGHGVGMSQYGASEMAKVGYTYKQILFHYYTEVTLKT